MTGHGEKLSRKAELFIGALLTQPTVTAAAQTVGVSESTARRWLQREEFQERYREARQEAVSHATARLQQASSQAVDTLTSVMGDPTAPAAARVGAAKVVLELARGATVEELEERYQELALVVEELRQNVYSARSRQVYS